MAKRKTIHVEGNEVSYILFEGETYLNISELSVLTNADSPAVPINRWIQTQATVGFLGAFEKKYNADFNLTEFRKFESNVGKPRFYFSPTKWLKETNAIGFKITRGRYGAVYAHSTIALHYASWLEPAYMLYMVEEFQRLKLQEAIGTTDVRTILREYVKVVDAYHSDKIKASRVPDQIAGDKKKDYIVFASDKDLINESLFNRTAKQWKLANPDKKGNMRDYASIAELVVLNIVLAIDANLIEWQSDQAQRRDLLSKIIDDIKLILNDNKAFQRLEKHIEKQKKLLDK